MRLRWTLSTADLHRQRGAPHLPRPQLGVRGGEGSVGGPPPLPQHLQISLDPLRLGADRRRAVEELEALRERRRAADGALAAANAELRAREVGCAALAAEVTG